MLAETAKVRGEAAETLAVERVNQVGGDEPKTMGSLVLARQLGESIMIGHAVTVEVVGLKSNTVRLRVVAPRSVAVHRREVYDAIRFDPRPNPSLPPVAVVGKMNAEVVGGGLAGGLVLTRRAGQTIMIGTDVAIDVVEARPGTVRLRVVAPRSVAVHRREVYDAIRAGGFREN